MTTFVKNKSQATYLACRFAAALARIELLKESCMLQFLDGVWRIYCVNRLTEARCIEDAMLYVIGVVEQELPEISE